MRSFLKVGLTAGALALLVGFAACNQQVSRSSSDESDDAPTAMARGSDKVVEKLTPAIVSETLDALSIKYEIQTDPRGYPMIAVETAPFPVRQFNILFFSCDGVESECDDIALWAWYDIGGDVSEKAIFAWNDPFQGRRWSTAYLDKDSDPALVMNINATGGLGERNLQILVNTFVEDMFAFHDLLKEQQVSSNNAADDVANAPSATNGAAVGYASSDVDGDILDMTALIKEFGGASFGRVKQTNKKL